MNKLLLEYLEFINEMPIQRFEPDSLNDMNNKEQIMKSKTIRKDFHHWPDADKRGLHNLRIVNKIKNGFKNVPWNFNFFFVQIEEPNYDRFLSRGLTKPNEIDKLFGEGFFDTIKPDSNAINVILMNNLSDENWRPINSAWMLAHRFVHALDGKEINIQPQIQEAFSYFLTLVKQIAKVAYSVKFSEDYHSEPIYFETYGLLLGKKIGNFKSARDETLINHYEFFHEIMVQYLLQGDIIFKKFPEQIYKDEKLNKNPENIKKILKLVFRFLNKIKQLIKSALDDCVGKILVT
jgi:hypothetical protein